MIFVFVDAEVTGEHARTTLVSVALVALDGDSLYVTFDDYDRNQVTDWLSENVLAHIDETRSVSSAVAFQHISDFLGRLGNDEPIRLVSAGLGADLFLLFELWKHEYPERKYFHALHCLPGYLNHALHMDLNTLFQVAGHDPGLDRDAYVGEIVAGARHDALHDAKVVRKCFLKLIQCSELARFREAAESNL